MRFLGIKPLYRIAISSGEIARIFLGNNFMFCTCYVMHICVLLYMNQWVDILGIQIRDLLSIFLCIDLYGHKLHEKVNFG